jgi:hypothetical protein
MIHVALPFILVSSYIILLCNLTFGTCKLLSDTEYHRIHFFLNHELLHCYFPGNGTIYDSFGE